MSHLVKHGETSGFCAKTGKKECSRNQHGTRGQQSITTKRRSTPGSAKIDYGFQSFRKMDGKGVEYSRKVPFEMKDGKR